MGLKGDINFTLIRTALANSAKTLLPPEERAKVSMAMCHDVKTADRFYSRNPSLQEAMRVRNMMAETLIQLNQPPTPPGQAGSSSSAQQIPWTEPGPRRPAKKAPAKRRRRTDSSSDCNPDSGVPVPYQESGTSDSDPVVESDEESKRVSPSHMRKCSVLLTKLKRQKEVSEKIKKVLEKKEKVIKFLGCWLSPMFSVVSTC
ncbi:uncharacterized protein LOC118562918 [Fundulus heteroclitus]|uniref:uncharacterized protein LOC118562918 n=1 Tax=Fundulus heteroclitus TaxID=8078 RepID=UPI00165CE399|nr:uncharacterized protein LOC118562918 [Fundulus heteroclitus]